MNDVEELLITRTKQLQLQQEFIIRLSTTLQQLRLTATDEQRTIIDEALADVPGPFRG